MIQVNIYYGGRGLIEDPTIYVIDKIKMVLEELNVNVKKYNLYEIKKKISSLPKTLKEADAVVFATSVEWFGIGGFMQEFLDAIWLYGDEAIIKKLYMMPVVLSTSYGEDDSYLYLKKAWRLLGGIPIDGISAYVENHVDFETNSDYSLYIEKKTESFYRAFTRKQCVLPSSYSAVYDSVAHSSAINLTPQESEQLSEYVSNESYVKTQKEDIRELSKIFRKELGVDDSEIESENEDLATADSDDIYIASFKEHFIGIPNLALSYLISLSDIDKNLFIDIDGKKINISYEKKEGEENHINLRMKRNILDSIIGGKIGAYTAFMAGDLTVKGDINLLKNFDKLFNF